MNIKKITPFLLLPSFFLPFQIVLGEYLLPFESDDTLDEIRYKIDHNGYSFEVSDNWVFKLSPEEKNRLLSRHAPAFPRTLILDTGTGPLAKHLGTLDLPEEFDWRNYDGHAYIGDIRDQGDCGSCYSFGACAAAEGTYNWATGNFDSNCADFSESYIIWCLGRLPAYNSDFFGCDGASYAYMELEALTVEGVADESDFPYQETDPGSCTHWGDQTTVFTSWHRVDCGDIEAIKTAIMSYGVVDAAVYVGSAFQAYDSGVYEDTNTDCDGSPCSYTTTNHAIALVGWDNSPPEGGGGVWILRNSWGTDWGESGYMRIRYTSAAVSCAVCYLVYQPPVSPTPTPIGYLTPTPTPSISPTPEGFHTPSPSATPSLTPSPAPRTIPFAEDFEGEWIAGAPEGWSKEYVMGNNDWTQSEGGYYNHPTGAHGGLYNALFFYPNWDDIATRLISPRLEFGPDVHNTRLSFWLAMENWEGDQDELSVFYRNSTEAEWTLLTHYDTSLSSWTEKFIDLPEPGDNYYICFEGTANYGYGICIDDVLVTGNACSPTPTPIPPPPLTATPTLYFPTPAPTCSTSCDFSVGGIVMDQVTSSPIPNATVWIEFADHYTSGTFTSASDGTYSYWTCVPHSPGAVLAWAAHPGYQTGYGATTWDCNAHREATIKLKKNPTPSPTITPKPSPYCQAPILDFNGDGTSDIAIYQESSGLWAIRGLTRLYFGGEGFMPVPGDYNGDGTTDQAVFRETSGLWAIRGISRVYFGHLEDLPVSGDYDGDGTFDLAVFRQVSGLWAIRAVSRTYFGRLGDTPVPGYYSGGNIMNIGIFRRASGLWAIKDVSRFYFGLSSDEPVKGNYTGGTGWTSGIYRPETGLWALRGVSRIYYGTYDSQPVPADYNGDGLDDIAVFRESSGLWAIRGITKVYFGSSVSSP